MQKIIGIPGYNLGENTFGIGKPYLEYFSKFGNVLILTPMTFIPVDLLVLPGGKDVHDGAQGGFSFYLQPHDPFLEYFDKYTLPQFWDRNIPMFGICRGMQTLMRHTGVPIIQNIDWGHGYSKDEKDDKANTLVYTREFRMLKTKFGVDKVGSWHHQCVMKNDLIGDWNLIAHTGDGVVEYAKHDSKPIFVTQSHPERNLNKLDKHIIKQLLSYGR
jgi:gamma-glutamyl-gamma-aminobutyrate hydrolase PuuD